MLGPWCISHASDADFPGCREVYLDKERPADRSALERVVSLSPQKPQVRCLLARLGSRQPRWGCMWGCLWPHHALQAGMSAAPAVATDSSSQPLQAATVHCLDALSPPHSMHHPHCTGCTIQTALQHHPHCTGLLPRRAGGHLPAGGPADHGLRL